LQNNHIDSHQQQTQYLQGCIEQVPVSVTLILLLFMRYSITIPCGRHIHIFLSCRVNPSYSAVFHVPYCSGCTPSYTEY
jgi:ABC-type microcin C transport system permease subunit YejB